MSKSFEELILFKVDSLLRVQTLAATRGMKQGEQIAFISRAGFQPKEIAELIGTTSNTVSVALSKLKKGAASRAKRT